MKQTPFEYKTKAQKIKELYKLEEKYIEHIGNEPKPIQELNMLREEYKDNLNSPELESKHNKIMKNFKNTIEWKQWNDERKEKRRELRELITNINMDEGDLKVAEAEENTHLTNGNIDFAKLAEKEASTLAQQHRTRDEYGNPRIIKSTPSIHDMPDPGLFDTDSSEFKEKLTVADVVHFKYRSMIKNT